MADWPGNIFSPVTVLSSFERKHSALIFGGMPTTSAVWPAANRAYYLPVVVETPCTVYKMMVFPSVQSGNLDVGIYSEDGTRLVSKGSTAVGTAGAIQVIDITDTPLNPGIYFLAINVDNTTAAFLRGGTGGADFYRSCGIQQQAVGAVALPSSTSFGNPSSAYAPLVNALLMNANI